MESATPALGFRLDHVVIRVGDLEAAIADYSAIGFTVTEGGEHPTLGSRNALICFEDDTYLELITFESSPSTEESKSAVMRRIRGWETANQGLVDFAVVPTNVNAALAAARDRGLPVEGPFPGSRKRPDGQEVAWQFGIPATPDMPFLCADVSARELRVPGGEARRHPNGAVGIHRIFVGVENLDESSKHYRALLGVEPRPPQTMLEVSRAVEFPIGKGAVVLGESEPAASHGRVFSTRKKGPVLVILRVKGDIASKVLDPALTHGVPIVCV
jgi:catechol 2,3-dioxygenase-like lactoylglutathione lyase family enzyme